VRSRALAIGALCLTLGAHGSGQDAQGSQQPPTTTEPAGRAPASPEELFDRLEQAWQNRDVEAYLSLWQPLSPEALEWEASLARSHFSADDSRLSVERPQVLPSELRAFKISVEVSAVTEPRGRFERWLVGLVDTGAGWKLVSREAAGEIDGLVHLSVDPEGFRADGLTLRLEDFELRLRHGTLFTSPPDVGPTLLVFVGEASVRVTPRPTTERQQLELFSGSTELRDGVRAAFIRIHPADLHRVLSPVRLEPDPAAAKRFGKARKLFDEQVGQSFVLDAGIPGSPWWVLPALGDAMVTFETRKHGTLTFTINDAEPENINLFDRAKRRQIVLYPAAGRPIQYSEDDQRQFDIVHHDLEVRFDPDRNHIEATDHLRLRLLQPTVSLRFRMDDALRVSSVRSATVGEHLFFRVRHQNSFLVSLGMLSGQTGEITLSVSYSGHLGSAPIDTESLQIFDNPRQTDLPGLPGFPLETVHVYTNRQPWYPQARFDDFATARIRCNVPERYIVLAGGVRRVLEQVEPERRVFEYEQQGKGKYITVAVGRLELVGRVEAGGVPLEAFAVARARGHAETLMERSQDILRFYKEEFGPYPYPSLRLGVMEGRTPGGHSPPGMVLIQAQPVLFRSLSRTDPGDFSNVPGFFLAHELAHQWWGHGVAAQNYHERWLSEGMAQYAAARWARRFHGEDTFRDILRRMARWARKLADKGPISLGHRLGLVENNPQIFRAIAYNKGAYVLHMLRGIVGDDAFREALISLQDRHRFRKIGTDELRGALEVAAGQDLAPYFRAWVYGTSIATLKWSARTTREASGYRTDVRVRATGLPAAVPLELALVFSEGRHAERVMLEPSGGRFTFRTRGRPRKVQVNGDLGLLAEVDEL